MSDSRFSNGHYEDALQYTKEILSSSSSMDEIVVNLKVLENIKKQQRDKKQTKTYKV